VSNNCQKRNTKKSGQMKGLKIIIGLAAVAGFGYFLFKKPSTTASLPNGTTPTSGNELGTDPIYQTPPIMPYVPLKNGTQIFANKNGVLLSNPSTGFSKIFNQDQPIGVIASNLPEQNQYYVRYKVGFVTVMAYVNVQEVKATGNV